jgi:hypothetical protein
MESSLDEFVRTLHEEKLKTMAERSKFTRDKIVFVLGIMGIGSVNLTFSGMNSSTILYMVPLVAFGYDLYINAMDEGIKRIGAFLSTQVSCSSDSEKNYENYVQKRRGKYAPVANVLFSLIGTLGAGIIVTLSTSLTIYAWWFVCWSIAIIGMYFLHKSHVASFDREDVDAKLKS